MSDIFKLFSSKKNIENIRDHITNTIQNEFQQNIGLRYDPLIETKVKEVASKVSDQLPEGKSLKDYVILMNKKVISLVLPTIRANALKEKPKSNSGSGSRRIFDDPQDLLKRRENPGIEKNDSIREQFNLPLDDMSRFPVAPYANNDTMMPPHMTKVEEENKGQKTLEMFNQLRSVYEREREESGLGVKEEKILTPPQIQGQGNKKILFRKVKMETPIHDSSDSGDSKDKIMEMIRPHFETEIVSKSDVDDSPNAKAFNVLKGAATIPLGHTVLQEGARKVDSLMPLSKEEKMVVRPKHKARLHFSSNYRHFNYHKSPSSFRVYLTSYYEKSDPYAYFYLPEYIDTRGNKVYDSIQIRSEALQHHFHIPYLRKLSYMTIDCVKVHQRHFCENHPMIYLHVSPFSEQEEQTFYHNQSHLHRTLLLYDEVSKKYEPPCEDRINIQKIIQEGYCTFHLYDSYGKYIHYEKDIYFIDSFKKYDGEGKIQIYIPKPKDHSVKEGSTILLYSLTPEENVYCKFGESVYAESFEIIHDKEFCLCALQVINDEFNYKLNFQELFEKSMAQLEEESHQKVEDLFYFVIQQVKEGRPIYFYCKITGFDKVGNILLFHEDAAVIVKEFENTEQFGFVKKNFQGKSCERSSSLFRREGFVIQEMSHNETHMILTIDGKEIDEDFQKEDAFLRIQSNQIDIQFSLG